MAPRSYGQLCGVAHALDVLGDRWTLLIVRELLLGPKRFGTLQETFPGLGPTLLSSRLRGLVDDGLVEHVTLPPPASVAAYALTPAGEGLRPAMDALALWGISQFDPAEEVAEHPEIQARGSWLASSLAAAAGADHGATAADATVNFDVDGDRFVVRVRDGRPVVAHGAAEAPDGTLAVTLREFYDCVNDERPPADPAGTGAVLTALRQGARNLQTARRAALQHA